LRKREKNLLRIKPCENEKEEIEKSKK